MNALAAVLAGVLFGVGLLLSGMTDPAKVIGFLDVTGRWDPSLALVMAGGIGVTLPGYRWLRARGCGYAGQTCYWPAAKTIDARLLLGAALFGVGWGLSGICPGPALMRVWLAAPGALWFVLPMFAGLLLFSRKG